MSKIRFLTIAVTALALLNVASLFFFLQRGPHPDPRRPRTTVIRRLHFDEAQVAAYDQLIRQHREAIQPKEDSMRTLRGQLYALLNAPAPARADSLRQRIGQLQMEIEATHFQHFTGIRGLCRPEQLTDFQSLSTELVTFFGPPRRPK